MVAYFAELDRHRAEDWVPFYSRAYGAGVGRDSYLVLPLFHLAMAWLGPLEDVTAGWRHHQLMDDWSSCWVPDLSFANDRWEDVLVCFADLFFFVDTR